MDIDELIGKFEKVLPKHLKPLADKIVVVLAIA